MKNNNGKMCHTKLTGNMMKAVELPNVSTSAYDITSPYHRITQLQQYNFPFFFFSTIFGEEKNKLFATLKQIYALHFQINIWSTKRATLL